jgi:hypothetical protein
MSDLYWKPGDPLEGPERWYPIEDYVGMYEVSTKGRIRRISGGRGVKKPLPRVLKATLTQDGYPSVRLSKDGKPKTVNVHVVVCTTFKGPPPPEIAGDAEVDHDDGDRTNAEATNLNWISKYANLDKRQYNSATTDEEIAALAGGEIA